MAGPFAWPPVLIRSVRTAYCILENKLGILFLQSPFYCHKGNHLTFLHYVKSNGTLLVLREMVHLLSFPSRDLSSKPRDIQVDPQNGHCAWEEARRVRRAGSPPPAWHCSGPGCEREGEAAPPGPQPLCGHVQGTQFLLLSKRQLVTPKPTISYCSIPGHLCTTFHHDNKVSKFP